MPPPRAVVGKLYWGPPYIFVRDGVLPKVLRMANGMELPGWTHSFPVGEPKKMPAAARTEVLPSANGTHATPTRGEMWVKEVEMMPRPTPLSPGNTSPFGTTEVLVVRVTVDCWPGIYVDVRFSAWTGGVSISQRR